MLKLGSLVISLWAVLNLVPSLVILVAVTYLGGNSPALYQLFGAEEVKTLSAELRASMNSVAVYANGLNVALAMLALCVIWLGQYRRMRWAYWALLASLGTALLAGIMADFVVGIVHPEVSILSGTTLAFGFACSAIGLFGNSGVSAAKASFCHR